MLTYFLREIVSIVVVTGSVIFALFIYLCCRGNKRVAGTYRYGPFKNTRVKSFVVLLVYLFVIFCVEVENNILSKILKYGYIHYLLVTIFPVISFIFARAVLTTYRCLRDHVPDVDSALLNWVRRRISAFYQVPVLLCAWLITWMLFVSKSFRRTFAVYDIMNEKVADVAVWCGWKDDFPYEQIITYLGFILMILILNLLYMFIKSIWRDWLEIKNFKCISIASTRFRSLIEIAICTCVFLNIAVFLLICALSTELVGTTDTCEFVLNSLLFLVCLRIPLIILMRFVYWYDAKLSSRNETGNETVQCGGERKSEDDDGFCEKHPKIYAVGEPIRKTCKIIYLLSSLSVVCMTIYCNIQYIYSIHHLLQGNSDSNIAISFGAIFFERIIFLRQLAGSHNVEFCRIISAACVLWLVTLITLAAIILPQSFYNVLWEKKYRQKAGVRKHELNGDARIINLSFLDQCINRSPVAIVVGLFLHILICSYGIAMSGEGLKQILDWIGFSKMQGAWKFIIALNSFPMFMSPVIASYMNRNGTLKRSMIRQIESRILSNLKDHLIVVGYGNLGITVVEKRFSNVLRKYRFSLTESFCVIPDSDYELRIIYKDIVTADMNKDVFYEVYRSEDRGSIGLAKIVHVADNKDRRLDGRGLASLKDSQSIYIIGLCEQCHAERTMRTLGIESCKYLVSATNTDDFPFWLVNERMKRGVFLPRVVLKVNKGSTFWEIEKTRRVMHTITERSFQLIYPPRNEADNIIRYVLALTRGCKTYREKALIIGSGRRLNHLISAMKREVSYCETRMLLLTDDLYIKSIAKDKPTQNEYCVWELFADRQNQKPTNINTRYVKRFEFDSVKSEILRITDSETENVTIIVFSDKKSVIMPILAEVIESIPEAMKRKIAICESKSIGAYGDRSFDELNQTA